MKCRMILFLLLGLLLSNATFGSEGDEKEGAVVNTHNENWGEKETRSFSSVPIITKEGNLIRIYSNIDLYNLQISVKDALGTIVYLDTVSVFADCVYSFLLPEIQEEGTCKLELICGQKYLYGYLVP